MAMQVERLSQSLALINGELVEGPEEKKMNNLDHLDSLFEFGHERSQEFEEWLDEIHAPGHGRSGADWGILA